jgi:hypothetical protein
MGLEFIARTLRTSLILSVVIFIFGTVYFDWAYSLGISIGLIFNCINLYFITGIVRRVITPDDKRVLPVIALSVIKFPALYFIGYLILISDLAPVVSYMIGFSILFGVIVLKVLGMLVVNSGWMKLADSKNGASR